MFEVEGWQTLPLERKFCCPKCGSILVDYNYEMLSDVEEVTYGTCNECGAKWEEKEITYWREINED